MSFSHDSPGTPAAVWNDAVAGLDLPALTFDGLDRVVVLGAHPDDETLGAGGLVGRAHDAGLQVDVVVVTRGEGSHPRSPTHGRERLAAVRTEELRSAVGVLSPGSEPVILGRPDGAVAAHEEELASYLVDLVGDGGRTLLVAPWRRDGHPDHEAAGRASATAAARTDARLLEYPVWFWHWARPDDAPWTAALRLDLDADTLRRKGAAIAEHRSQVRALSEQDGDEVLLDADFLSHFAAPYEIYWEQPVDDQALEDLHARVADPWGADHRFYEQRKRALVTAMLPRATFRHGVEVGCSTGALAEVLAQRCSRLTALDASPSAVAAATARLSALGHVDVVRAQLPEGFPDSTVDLVVLSEVGYFLSPADLTSLIRRIERRLDPDGVVVLCHWRHPVRGWPLDGPAVHEQLVAAEVRPVIAEYRDRDVEILVLGAPGQLPDPHESVAPPDHTLDENWNTF